MLLHLINILKVTVRNTRRKSDSGAREKPYSLLAVQLVYIDGVRFMPIIVTK